MRRQLLVLVPTFLLLCGGVRADHRDLLAQIKAVGREGQGHATATKAFKELVQQGPDVLLDVLAALDDATPRAANWLRSAFEAIADRAHASGKLSAATLEAFVLDTKHSGAGRRLAFEWLVKLDPTARGRLLPGMVNDPGQELRREAVEGLLKGAQAAFDGDDKRALLQYKEILSLARDRDQVKIACDRLAKLGEPVDLNTHLGFITRWAVVGPFDNSKGVGFNTVNPPERGVDLKAEYVGKDNQKVRWREHTTEPAKGTSDFKSLALVDFNKVLGGLHGTTAFAFTVVEAPQERPVELRAGSNNAVRIWLNGKEIFFREEYHHGFDMDQHVGKGTLKAGRNEILVKVLQNEQTEDWAQRWSFQLRVCDALGTAVPVTVVTDKQ